MIDYSRLWPRYRRLHRISSGKPVSGRVVMRRSPGAARYEREPVDICSVLDSSTGPPPLPSASIWLRYSSRQRGWAAPFSAVFVRETRICSRPERGFEEAGSFGIARMSRYRSDYTLEFCGSRSGLGDRVRVREVRSSAKASAGGTGMHRGVQTDWNLRWLHSAPR